MHKVQILLATAVLAIVSAAPAFAYSYAYGPSFTNPDGNGGCLSATYYDVQSGDAWVSYDVPALDDTETIELQASYHNTGPYPSVFACNNGVLTNVTNGNMNGDWYGN